MSLVLIAEDDPAIAQLLEEILRDRLGAEVRIVPNGALVTDAIAERRPDLIVLDLGLPGLSGLDVFALVQNSPGLASVPILFLTGDPDQARSATRHTHVMGKPFNLDDLLAAVGGLIRTAPAAA